MPWRCEDWEHWLTRHPERLPDPLHVRALQEILLGIPAPKDKSVVDFGDGRGPHVARLHEHFASIETWPSHSTPGRRFDLAVAAHSIVAGCTAELDRAFERAHACLVEGGLFLTTFPAVERGEVHLPLVPEAADGSFRPPSLHEVQLQYRLRRARFQGLRIRRFPGSGDEPAVVLAMAARRAFN